MKKTVLTVAVLMLVGDSIIGTVNADPMYLHVPTVLIDSPSPSFVCCYQNSSIPLQISVTVSPIIVRIVYSLDGENNVTLSGLAKGIEGITANTTLRNLAEGDHTLNAYAFDSNGEVLSAQTTFTVDSTYRSPQVTIISPLNKTYTTNSIPLIFSISTSFEEPQYVLDKGPQHVLDNDSGPVNGNTTMLSNLQGYTRH